MAFAPTAERPLDMIDGGSTLDNLPEPARIVDRMLIWAMAPVAAEQLVYRECLVSEPELAIKLLQAARRREASLGVDVQQGDWARDEDSSRARWAYAEAKRLLQRYSGLREKLQECEDECSTDRIVCKSACANNKKCKNKCKKDKNKCKNSCESEYECNTSCADNTIPGFGSWWCELNAAHDPSFCTNAAQKNKCNKTCGLCR